MIFASQRQRRLAAFAAASTELERADYPKDTWAYRTVMEQIDYLVAVVEGVKEGDLLARINLGVVTAKEIEPAEDSLLDALYKVSTIAREMASEYPAYWSKG